jgi:hypothetical protein
LHSSVLACGVTIPNVDSYFSANLTGPVSRAAKHVSSLLRFGRVSGHYQCIAPTNRRDSGLLFSHFVAPAAHTDQAVGIC